MEIQFKKHVRQVGYAQYVILKSAPMPNKKITVKITEEQHKFLDLIQHEDAAKNQSEAIQWCIDACMKIEMLYGIDACYISYNDIRLKENQP